jgi:hypothetical protein
LIQTFLSPYDEFLLERYPGAEYSKYQLLNPVYDKGNTSCISFVINNTENYCSIHNIANKSICNIERYDSFSGLSIIFLLIYKLLRKINFDGKIEISDQAGKDGKRIAFHYMKKNKNDDVYFSKYQDYGFQILNENIDKLIFIKRQVINNIDYNDLEERYGYDVSNLLRDMINPNYSKSLKNLTKQLKQITV